MAPLVKTDTLMRNVLVIRDALGVEVARQHIEKDAPKRCQSQSYFSQGDLTGWQAVAMFIKAQPQMTPEEWKKWQAMTDKEFKTNIKNFHASACESSAFKMARDPAHRGAKELNADQASVILAGHIDPNDEISSQDATNYIRPLRTVKPTKRQTIISPTVSVPHTTT